MNVPVTLEDALTRFSRRRRLVACATLVFAACPAASAANMTVILDNGFVASLSGDGTRFVGNVKPLFGAGATDTRLFAAVADYRFGRLYLTPELAYDDRKTLIYDLHTLAEVGEMPGVTSVSIPVTAGVDDLVTHDFVAAPETSLRTAWNLERSGHMSQTAQIRARGASLRIKSAQVIDLANENSSFLCYSSARHAYVENVIDLPPDSSNKQASHVLRTHTPVMSNPMVVSGCWPNGDVWGEGAKSPMGAFVRYRESRHDIARLPALDSWDPSHAATQTMGNNGRYLAVMENRYGPGTFKVEFLDFSTGRTLAAKREVREINDEDSLFPVGISSDRNSWFVALGHPVRGTDSQIDMAGRLFRIGMDGAVPVFEEVALPVDFLQVNALAIANSMATSADSQHATKARQTLAVLTAASVRNRLVPLMRHVGIIAVLLEP